MVRSISPKAHARKARPWLAISFILFLLGLFMYPWGQRSIPENTKEKSAQLASERIIARDIEFVQGGSGQIDWKIKASEAKYTRSQSRVVIEHPQILAYLGKNREEFLICSKQGELDQKKGNFYLQNKVIGKFDTLVLRADTMHFNNTTGKIVLKGHVSLLRPDAEIRMPTVDFDVDTKTIVASDGITAIFLPSSTITLKQ